MQLSAVRSVVKLGLLRPQLSAVRVSVVKKVISPPTFAKASTFAKATAGTGSRQSTVRSLQSTVDSHQSTHLRQGYGFNLRQGFG